MKIVLNETDVPLRKRASQWIFAHVSKYLTDMTKETKTALIQDTALAVVVGGISIALAVSSCGVILLVNLWTLGKVHETVQQAKTES